MKNDKLSFVILLSFVVGVIIMAFLAMSLSSDVVVLGIIVFFALAAITVINLAVRRMARSS